MPVQRPRQVTRDATPMPNLRVGRGGGVKSVSSRRAKPILDSKGRAQCAPSTTQPQRLGTCKVAPPGVTLLAKTRRPKSAKEIRATGIEEGAAYPPSELTIPEEAHFSDEPNHHDSTLEESSEEWVSPIIKPRLKRFQSISEEIEALMNGEIDQPSTIDEEDSREPCPHCGRKFKADRLSKHITVCKHVHEGKEARGVFGSNAAMQLGSHKPLSKSLPGSSKPLRLSGTKSSKDLDWRATDRVLE